MLLLLPILFGLSVFGQDRKNENTPLALVEAQLAAYNARDIDAFLQPFADDVEWFEFPDKLLGKGKEQMRKQYGATFEQLPDLHCEIKQRIIQGDVVIDKEFITGVGDTPLEAIAIYHIKNNKIQQVYFVQ